MSYIHKLDKVIIFFDGDSYHIKMLKKIEASGSEPVEFIYARINMSVIPENNVLTSEYYRDNPIDLTELDFSAHMDGSVPLKHNILNKFPSNIELALLLHEEGKQISRHIYPGETTRIHHRIRATIWQWGNWLQRAIRVPTEQIQVSLIFPKNLVTVKAGMLVGGQQRPLPSPLSFFSNRHFDWWHWKTNFPRIQDRFQFVWDFEDNREIGVREVIQAEYDRDTKDFFVSPDGAECSWFESKIYFSPMQAQVIQLLVDNLRSPFGMSEDAILETIGSKSDRLRDIFKYKQELWQTLIEVNNRRAELNVKRSSWLDYNEKLLNKKNLS